MGMFQVLDTPPNRRQAKLDEDLARFPHVNCDLFHGAVRIPDFDAEMRRALLDAGQFDWTAISPAIFGALFQSVMEPAERRAQGAHYTTEKNILKVIEPLFLDDLRAEFRRLQARRDGRAVADLRRFRDRLGTLRLFDPACGCGNFLIIAYRELRTLEIDVLREMASGPPTPDHDKSLKIKGCLAMRRVSFPPVCPPFGNGTQRTVPTLQGWPERPCQGSRRSFRAETTRRGGKRTYSRPEASC